MKERNPSLRKRYEDYQSHLLLLRIVAGGQKPDNTSPERALESPHLEHQATRQLLARAEESAGVPILILADNECIGLELAYTVFACQNRPFHLVHYDPHYTDVLNHTVAHECAHILRWAAAPPEERLLPGLTPKNFRRARHELRNDRSELIQRGLSTNDARDIITWWIYNATARVVNIPIDIRIERWLHKEYPTLRPIQTKSEKIVLRQREIELAPQVRATTSANIFQILNALNYVYAAEVGPLVGEPDATAIYRKRAIRKLGERLREILRSRDAFHNGEDRKTIDLWAEAVGIRHWYKWVPQPESAQKA